MPAPSPDAAGPRPADGVPAADLGPDIFTAMQEQLGLKLESAKGPVEILVIDHVERLSENVPYGMTTGCGGKPSHQE